jgi:MFS family permease
MSAITLLGERGASPLNASFLAPAFLSLILGWRFIRHTKRAEAPYIPYRLLTGEGFATMNLLNGLYGTAVFGFAALAPLYAENRYHFSLSSAGTMQSARSIGMIAVAGAAAMHLRKTGYRRPMIAGFLVCALGMTALALPPFGIPAYGWLVVFSLVTGVGMGLAAPATNNALLQLAPDQVAAITGLRSMFRQSGSILYVSVATALIARSTHPGLLQADIFVVQGITLGLMSLLTLRVPDHRGSW